MRNDYLKAAREVVIDPYILVNMVSLRVKQLRHGSRPLIESLEKLELEDVALREIAEGKISYEMDTGERGPRSYKSGFSGPPPERHAEHSRRAKY